MNVFFQELKSYRFGLMWWSLGMLGLIGSGMLKFATYSSSGQSISSLLNQFPPMVKTIFGMSGFDLDKASGYFGVLFMYIALMAAAHAVLLGAGIISKEERDRTSEFLFVKPISRFKAITAKIMAGLTNLVVFNIVTLGSSLYFVNYFTKDTSFTNFIFISMAGMFLLQLLFFFIGTVVAAISRRPKSSSSIAASLLLFAYILTFFINLNGHVDWLKCLAPFNYFDAHQMLASGKLDPLYVGLSLILIIIMAGVTYRTYRQKDLGV